MGTCSPDGAPNVALLSRVHQVDDAHVSPSYPFFGKTRRNIRVDPAARLRRHQTP